MEILIEIKFSIKVAATKATFTKYLFFVSLQWSRLIERNLQLSFGEINREAHNWLGKPVVFCVSSWQEKTHTILRGLGHVTVNKPVISIIRNVAHTWPLCSVQISVDGVNPQ